ncbi:MAG: hypothetical protein GY712_03695 [Oceanicoccus sp.]|uniref:hypothetical protein n=1 Tax=Oceanicoccus sp. TaxID=2691044 RepID=UPI002602063E|nr:hypothetical protein [Oceanicoccus sp.]MCP3907099.1 hypothetical protein [Oceanicoccus sp.]
MIGYRGNMAMPMVVVTHERRLLREISGLTQIISEPTDPLDRAGKSAHAFLKQLLHDRMEKLRVLKYRKRTASAETVI